MDLVNSVFETAKQFTEKPKHVFINDEEIEYLVNDLKLITPPTFPKQIDDSDQFKTTLLELVGDSINYCYWYGNANIRPGGACAGRMYELVEEAFSKYKAAGGNYYFFETCIDNLIKLLSVNRFPMLEERIKHLGELRLNGEKFVNTVLKYKNDSVEYLLNSMVQIFPGYASDIFLKRALLFFAQLNRKFGWFEEDMKTLPVPADYQVPKMLENQNIIVYEEELKWAIDNNTLIAKGSVVECEIRASTIIACKRICDQSGWTMPQVDGFFWLRRKEATSPFHLTVTTDY